jgi:hypothetical protein
MLIYVAPVLVGLLYIFVMSALREPARRRFNAIMIAGAGAAYLSSSRGFGAWELVFTAAVTYCAYRGLDSYAWIGVAWLLHAGWDLLHYFKGAPILPFAGHSSLGCAICDPVIALWCLRGGPSLLELVRQRLARTEQRADRPDVIVHGELAVLRAVAKISHRLAPERLSQADRSTA